MDNPLPASQARETEQPLTHPEEMTSNFSFRAGDKIAMQASARATPAGIISIGLGVAAILLAFGYAVRSFRRTASPR